jgi:uncharacterized membrane protein YfbV (UPF0208 family)
MSQKNETPVLVLSLLITVGLIAGGLWWFTKKSGFDLGKSTSSQSENSADDNSKTPQSSSEQLSGSTFASVQNVPWAKPGQKWTAFSFTPTRSANIRSLSWGVEERVYKAVHFCLLFMKPHRISQIGRQHFMGTDSIGN